ncbi:WG repeat-containing protein [Cytophaga aurantiaca]|uniref:WG repeat-containing protein n=1 Tax=Cytophaga aurantiaca TaxID=29530 RepID=UPI000365DBDE|nr:WG repeat-containing protein [Cytophaga aurantiaca]
MNTVTDNFKKIHGWLEKNADKILNESLNAGAEKETIEELESVINKELPTDFKELYALHDGLNEEANCGSLFYGMLFYSIEGIISDHKSRTFIYPLKKCSLEINPQNINNPDWLCIAFDGSHVSIRLDLAPNTTGIYGQVILVDDEYGVAFVIAKSVSEFVEKFANDLLNDKYTLDEDALEDGNQFLSADTSIDLVNWYTQKEWKEFIKPNEVVKENIPSVNVVEVNEPSINIDDYQWTRKPLLDIGNCILSVLDNSDLLMIYDRSLKKYGLINNEGEQIMPAISIIPIREDEPYITRDGDVYNLVNANGGIIFSTKAHTVNELYPLYLFQTYNDGSVLINKQGKQVKKIFTNQREFTEGSLGIGVITDGNNSAHGFIDEEGKTVVDFKYRSVNSFSEGLAVVEREDYVREYIDTNGATVFVLREHWLSAGPFKNGYAMVNYRDNEKGGFMFINRNFEVVSKDYYSSYSGMQNGLFIVSKDGFEGGVDVNGDTIIPFDYSEIRGSSDSDNVFIVSKENFKNHFEDKDKLWARENVFKTYGALDQFGNTILECKFPGLTYAGNDLFILRKEKHVGYINSKEEVVLPFAFDALRPITNGEAWVQYKGKWGIIKIG